MRNMTSILAALVAMVVFASRSPVVRAADDDMAKSVMVHTAEWCHGQIQMSKLAEKSTSVGVRRYGTSQVDAFTKMLDECKAFSKEYKYAIPVQMGDKQKDTYEHLQKWTGQEFDARYMKDQIDEQKAFMDMFEKAAKEAGNKEIRDWASKWFKDCRDRHNDAVDLYEKVKK